METHEKELALSVRIRLAELNMSRRALARKAGLRYEKIRKICDGTGKTKISDIVALEKALDIQIMHVPDTFRDITVSMNIDSSRHQATVTTSVVENGKVKTDNWTVRELISTANALNGVARGFMERALWQMTEEEKEK